MDRLTIRNSDGSVSQPTHSTVEKIFDRLAAYEDTGLTPEEIVKMSTAWEDTDGKLKPCPFYGGGRARIEPIGRYDGGEKFKVRCVECLAVSYGYDSPEEAAEEWNRRYDK